MGNGWVEKELKDTYRGLSRQIISTISSPKYGVGIPKNIYSPEAAKSRFSQSWVTGAWKPLTFCHNSLKLGSLWDSGGVLAHSKTYFISLSPKNIFEQWKKTIPIIPELGQKRLTFESISSPGCLMAVVCTHKWANQEGLRNLEVWKGQMLGFVNTQFPSYDLHSFKKNRLGNNWPRKSF